MVRLGRVHRWLDWSKSLRYVLGSLCVREEQAFRKTPAPWSAEMKQCVLALNFVKDVVSGCYWLLALKMLRYLLRSD